MSTRYYRLQHSPAETVLDPTRWTSYLWTGERMVACASCSGEGRIYTEADDRQWAERCDICRGTGEIDDSSRRGVSCCRSIEDLMAYMSDRAATILPSSIIVEMAGDESGDEDWDVADGARLIFPREVLSWRPLTTDEIARLTDEQ